MQISCMIYATFMYFLFAFYIYLCIIINQIT